MKNILHKVKDFLIKNKDNIKLIKKFIQVASLLIDIITIINSIF